MTHDSVVADWGNLRLILRQANKHQNIVSWELASGQCTQDTLCEASFRDQCSLSLPIFQSSVPSFLNSVPCLNFYGFQTKSCLVTRSNSPFWPSTVRRRLVCSVVPQRDEQSLRFSNHSEYRFPERLESFYTSENASRTLPLPVRTDVCTHAPAICIAAPFCSLIYVYQQESATAFTSLAILYVHSGVSCGSKRQLNNYE